jgi:hypothetical protein
MFKDRGFVFNKELYGTELTLAGYCWIGYLSDEF